MNRILPQKLELRNGWSIEPCEYNDEAVIVRHNGNGWGWSEVKLYDDGTMCWNQHYISVRVQNRLIRLFDCFKKRSILK